MTREFIRDIMAKSVAALQESGALPTVTVPAIDVEREPLAEGDEDVHEYLSDVAITFAAALRANGQPAADPRQLAEAIADHLSETVALVPAYDDVQRVTVEGDGYIRVRLTNAHK